MNLFKNKVTDYFQIKYREKRNLFFLSFITPSTLPISILDVGGTVKFWAKTGLINKNNVHVTVLNLQLFESEYSNIESVVGDARNLSQYKNNEFDIVFSNSVIEHVGDFKDQSKMANEVRRVAVKYFIQTPNYYFPIEPHYRVIGFQFLSANTKAYILKTLGVGRVSKLNDRNSSLEEANRIRLLKPKEMKVLFPKAEMYKERFLGLTKSIIAYKGFN